MYTIHRLFKWYRLAAIRMVILNLYTSDVRNRKTDCALALASIMIWLLNGLYRRPEDNYLTLAQEICQHVPIDYDAFDPDEEEDIIPLMYDAGLYFVCDIVVDDSGTYRLPFHKAISDKAIQDAFKIPLDEVRRIMTSTSNYIPRQIGHNQRTSNRSARRTIHVGNIRPRERSLPQVRQDLLQNIKKRPEHRMMGADVRHFAIHGGGNRDAQVLLQNDEHDREDTITKVQVIMEQFYYDIIQESPNRKKKTDGSWTNIPKEHRNEEATEHLFTSSGLPFFAAQYTICTEEQWELHFNRMFPKDIPDILGQNFKKCTYFQEWLQLLQRLTVSSKSRVRATVRAKFNSLIWIPYTGSDRMWSTRPNSSRGWFGLPKGQPLAGPQIAFNPNLRHKNLPHPYLRPSPQALPPPSDDNSESDNNNDHQSSRIQDHASPHSQGNRNQPRSNASRHCTSQPSHRSHSHRSTHESSSHSYSCSVSLSQTYIAIH